MYNKELKEQFIADTTSSKKTKDVRTAIFEHFEKYEEEKGADLCTMTVEEIQEIINPLIRNVTTRSNINVITCIRSYLKYCHSRGVSGASLDGLKITSTNIEAVREKTVKNPVQLKKYIDDVFTSRNGTIYEPMKCYYWAAYGGCSEQEVMSLTSDDIDLDNRIIHCKSGDGIIYEEGIESFRQCVNATSFIYMNGFYTKKGDTVRDRLPGNYIFRGIRGLEKPVLSNFKTLVSKKTTKALADGKTDIQLTYHSVWLSGVFYRIKQLEDAGFVTDKYFESLTNMRYKRSHGGDDYIEWTRNVKNRDLRISKEQNEICLQLYRFFVQDYENWKLTII